MKGSTLFKEIKNLYKLYKSGNPTTLSQYKHLFKVNTDPSEASTPTEESTDTDGRSTNASSESANADDESTNTSESPGTNSKSTHAPPPLSVPPFVHFQQMLIHKKVKMISSEEVVAVEKYIKELHAAAMKVWEQPWMTTSRSSKLPKELKASRIPGKTEEELEMEYYQK